MTLRSLRESREVRSQYRREDRCVIALTRVNARLGFAWRRPRQEAPGTAKLMVQVLVRDYSTTLYQTPALGGRLAGTAGCCKSSGLEEPLSGVPSNRVRRSNPAGVSGMFEKPCFYGVQRAGREPLVRFMREALEAQGCRIIFASEPNQAPFVFTFETTTGERMGVVAYAFTATRTVTKNRPRG